MAVEVGAAPVVAVPVARVVVAPPAQVPNPG